MKKNIAIIAFLVIAQIGAFALKSHAQNPLAVARFDSTMIGRYEVIADETVISFTDKGAKIECDNDKIFVKLLTKYQDIFKRYQCQWRTDRNGRYKHYSIFLSKENGEIVKTWAKANL